MTEIKTNLKNKPSRKLTLPDGFLLGAATSSHQIEGNNYHNDWWYEEQKGKLPASGIVTDHYNRYEEDFKIAKSIGLQALRISIEWSRIEPEPGKYNFKEIEHYRKVLLAMKEIGLKRMVTLHHFTLPLWLYKKNGFANSESIEHFTKYASLIAAYLGDEIDLWNTINEPEVFTYMSSIQGFWPPFTKNPWRAYKLFSNLAKAHNSAYEAIKKLIPDAQISIAKNNVYNEAFRPNNKLDKLAVQLNNWFGNYWFLDKIKRHIDFIGLNYYFYHSLTVNSKGIVQKNLDGPKSDMGWRTYPKGLYFLLKDLHNRYHLPIYITENGIANAHDDMRQDFIHQHLQSCKQAVDEGVDVRGYFYWSLTDTHEWHDGFNPKFGLVEINFETLERKVRDSAKVFKQL